ncbi:XRE family transcriptional regulator [Streptococcus gallolyticus]|uniref:helix-turn-helix domain-containing protein n=1 Tax=Streptococcus hepaticus TaxID=3349163 RepID=UPI001C9480F7|nr:XRE family transcriptional regulator [Streptococcus gallolyticus]MBY5042172.1 XRE family transcriptional regulator [Streptococcus gallolyticus]
MFSNERLKQRRKEKGHTQQAVAEQLGINRASYTSWELGRAKPNQANLDKLAAILEVEPTYFESSYAIVSNYLQLSAQNRLKAELYVEELLEAQEAEQRAAQIVPLFAVSVLENIPLSAGHGASYFDDYSQTTVYAEQEYYYDFACFVDGESMQPAFQNGEVAMFKESSFDYDGAVYAISLNGSTYIKKVYREANRYRIESINPEYQDMYAYEEDEFQIVGKVIGHFMPIEQ